MRWARAACVASIPLLLYGCAPQAVVVAPHVPPPGPAVARPGRPGFVIGAPHATSDAPAADIAAELARRTGFGLVVGARDPDGSFERRVQETAQGRLTFYAEVHGATGRESANRIQIGAAGADRELANRLRALLELIRDAHLRGRAGTPRLDVVVETGRDGMPRASGRALHLELPRAARVEAREPYVAILAEFLAQAATLPAGR